jgi:hypothetical protein
MKCFGKIAVCLAAVIALGAAVRADEIALNDNPYSLIVERNIFGLNPPPPPVDPNAAPPEPPVKITPNGIMSIFGQWQVLFKTSVGGKPGEKSYMLGEGQMDDEIEVVKVDEKNSIVTFNNHGLTEKLQLATAPSSAATVPGVPAAGFNPAAGIGFSPAAPGGAGYNGGSGINPIDRGGNNVGGRNLGGGQSGAGISLDPAHATSIPSQQQAPMDPEVQQVLIVANHLKALQDGDPVAQIFPVTDADAEAGIPSNTATPTNSP